MVSGRFGSWAPADDISAAAKIALRNRFRHFRINYFLFRAPPLSLQRKNIMIRRMHAKVNAIRDLGAIRRVKMLRAG
jgi:hypothetical protein